MTKKEYASFKKAVQKTQILRRLCCSSTDEGIIMLARISNWTFKKEKRNDGFAELDLMMDTLARKTRGFRGELNLISRDDPNTGIIITLWDNEESLKASEALVFETALQRVKDYLAVAPKPGNHRVFSAELRQF